MYLSNRGLIVVIEDLQSRRQSPPVQPPVRGLDFRVLGSLEVWSGGRRLSLGGPRQRAVLAMLLLSPGRIVSVDSMIEQVWNGRPPTTGRAQVTICVAGLRKIFRAAGYERPVITTAPPGYTLSLEGHRLDAAEFSRMVARGQELARRENSTEVAAAVLQEALAMWHGPALANVYAHCAEAEAVRLAEARMLAVEQYTGLALQLGRHRALVGELAALVRAEPLREQLRGYLMLALHRSGRRPEALKVFQEGRRISVEELGLEPGAELRELHETILRDQPAAAAPVNGRAAVPHSFTMSPSSPSSPASPSSGTDGSVTGTRAPTGPAAGPAAPAPGGSEAPGPARRAPAQLPSDVAGFVGRRRALAALDGALAGRSARRPVTVCFVTGGPGTGKSGLAVHWAHRVAGRFPDGQLYVDLREAAAEAVGPARPHEVLHRFLRALGQPREAIPADAQECGALYRSLLHGRRVLVVLDNATSFSQVRPLLPGSGECCVVVTGSGGLGELDGGGGLRIGLGTLRPADSAELLARIVHDGRVEADPSATARLGELCGHLPLALRSAGARLVGKPHWDVADLVARLAEPGRRLDELGRGDDSLRARLDASRDALDPAAALAYERLGVIAAAEFDVREGALALGVGAVEAEDLMERLVDAHLLEVAGRDERGGVRYRFHELLRLHAGAAPHLVAARMAH